MITKEFIAGEKNLAQEFFSRHTLDDHVIFMGGGRALYWYDRLLRQHGFVAERIIDNNESKWGTKLFDIPVCSFDDVKNDFELEHVEVIVTAPKYKRELIDSIKTHLGDVPTYSFEAEIYCDFCSDVDNYDRLERLYRSLSDDKSRIVLDSVIKGRITGNQDYFIDIMEPDQYFPEGIIELSDHETLVELGSNDGGTLSDMLNRINRHYNEIYCFEPDKQAFEALSKVVANERGNIYAFEKATGAEHGYMSLLSNAEYGVSQLSAEESSYKVEVVRLDDVITSPVTYIKMDIEGAELDSLKGMERIIRENRPKMAICVYHNNADILDIPEYVRKLVPEYKIYLRHHNWGAAETVLYCTLDTN